MLAVSLLVFLVAEVSLYFAAARHFLSASPALAALAALFGVLVVRALVALLIWTIALTQRTPWPALGPRRALAMVLGDYLSFVLCFVVIMPCERLWMGRDRLHAGRTPVVLIHGYHCSRGVWWWLRRRLEAAGWPVATINLEPVYAGIDDYVEPLARRIDAVRAATGAARVILVGHSMGGLVARAYLRRHGPACVARLVTLGTPHRGSALARIAPGRNARQMEPGNDWLRRLGEEAPGVDTVVLYSPHDNYVVPQALLEFPGVPQQRIDGVGHLAMLFSPRVAGALLAALHMPAGSSAGWKLRQV